MFCENLRLMRKKRGLSQEALAMRLNVVRQTVSKWENGISVPDAEQLIAISEVLDVSVGDLLGNQAPVEYEYDPMLVAKELALLNEQLATKNQRTHRILKVLKFILIGIIISTIIIILLNYIPTK